MLLLFLKLNLLFWVVSWSGATERLTAPSSVSTRPFFVLLVFERLLFVLSLFFRLLAPCDEGGSRGVGKTVYTRRRGREEEAHVGGGSTGARRLLQSAGSFHTQTNNETPFIFLHSICLSASHLAPFKVTWSVSLDQLNYLRATWSRRKHATTQCVPVKCVSCVLSIGFLYPFYKLFPTDQLLDSDCKSFVLEVWCLTLACNIPKTAWA